jgi:uncharacterized membrane protein
MIALVFLATYIIQVPIIATQGYFNLGDIMIFVAALTFGPIVGGVSGAVGSALSDAISGFGIFAPFTFVIKGLEGFVAGLVARRVPGLTGKILAWIAGSIIMVTGYFVSEWLFIAWIFGSSDFTGFAAAFGELPFNIVQVAVGGIIGIPISFGIRYALKSTPYYSRLITTSKV